MVTAPLMGKHRAVHFLRPLSKKAKPPLSYGSDLGTLWRRVAEYVDRILKGANPADLPIEQPVGLDLVLNLDAAKAIGVSVPRPLLERANRVVQ
jgi:putative ABC transport system substrate-binding protein